MKGGGSYETEPSSTAFFHALLSQFMDPRIDTPKHAIPLTNELANGRRILAFELKVNGNNHSTTTYLDKQRSQEKRLTLFLGMKRSVNAFWLFKISKSMIKFQFGFDDSFGLDLVDPPEKWTRKQTRRSTRLLGIRERQQHNKTKQNKPTKPRANVNRQTLALYTLLKLLLAIAHSL